MRPASPYGTIYVANGTFQILSDRQQALATLQRFWQHLTPGGQLLLEMSVPDEVTHGPTCHDVDHPIRGTPSRVAGQRGRL